MWLVPGRRGEGVFPNSMPEKEEREKRREGDKLLTAFLSLSSKAHQLGKGGNFSSRPESPQRAAN